MADRCVRKHEDHRNGTFVMQTGRLCESLEAHKRHTCHSLKLGGLVGRLKAGCPAIVSSAVYDIVMYRFRKNHRTGQAWPPAPSVD